MLNVNLNQTETSLLRQAHADIDAARAAASNLLNLIYRTRGLQGLYTPNGDYTALIAVNENGEPINASTES